MTIIIIIIIIIGQEQICRSDGKHYLHDLQTEETFHPRREDGNSYSAGMSQFSEEGGV